MPNKRKNEHFTPEWTRTHDGYNNYYGANFSPHHWYNSNQSMINHVRSPYRRFPIDGVTQRRHFHQFRAQGYNGWQRMAETQEHGHEIQQMHGGNIRQPFPVSHPYGFGCPPGNSQMGESRFPAPFMDIEPRFLFRGFSGSSFESNPGETVMINTAHETCPDFQSSLWYQHPNSGSLTDETIVISDDEDTKPLLPLQQAQDKGQGTAKESQSQMAVENAKQVSGNQSHPSTCYNQTLNFSSGSTLLALEYSKEKEKSLEQSKPEFTKLNPYKRRRKDHTNIAVLDGGVSSGVSAGRSGVAMDAPQKNTVNTNNLSSRFGKKGAEMFTIAPTSNISTLFFKPCTTAVDKVDDSKYKGKPSHESRTIEQPSSSSGLVKQSTDICSNDYITRTTEKNKMASREGHDKDCLQIHTYATIQACEISGSLQSSKNDDFDTGKGDTSLTLNKNESYMRRSLLKRAMAAELAEKYSLKRPALTNSKLSSLTRSGVLPDCIMSTKAVEATVPVSKVLMTQCTMSQKDAESISKCKVTPDTMESCHIASNITGPKASKEKETTEKRNNNKMDIMVENEIISSPKQVTDHEPTPMRKTVFELAQKQSANAAFLYMSKMDEWEKSTSVIQQLMEKLKVSLATVGQDTNDQMPESICETWRKTSFLVECLHAEMEVERLSLRPAIMNKSFHFSEEMKEIIGSCIAGHFTTRFTSIKSAIHELTKSFQKLNHDNKTRIKDYNSTQKREEWWLKPPLLLLLNQKNRFSLYKERKPLADTVTPGLVAGLYGAEECMEDRFERWLSQPKEQKDVTYSSPKDLHLSTKEAEQSVNLTTNNCSRSQCASTEESTNEVRDRSKNIEHICRRALLVAHKIASDRHVNVFSMYDTLFAEWEKRETYIERLLRRIDRDLSSPLSQAREKGILSDRDCRTLAEISYFMEALNAEMELERHCLKSDNLENNWIFPDAIESELGVRRCNDFNSRYLTIQKNLKRTSKDYSRFINENNQCFRPYNRKAWTELKVTVPYMISLTSATQVARIKKAMQGRAANPSLSPALQAIIFGEEHKVDNENALSRRRRRSTQSRSSEQLEAMDDIDLSMCTITRYDEASLQLCGRDGPSLCSEFQNLLAEWDEEASNIKTQLESISEDLGACGRTSQLCKDTLAACRCLVESCSQIQSLYIKYTCAKLSQQSDNQTLKWRFSRAVCRLMGRETVDNLSKCFENYLGSLKPIQEAFYQVCFRREEVIRLFNKRVGSSASVRTPMPVSEVSARVTAMFFQGILKETPLEQYSRPTKNSEKQESLQNKSMSQRRAAGDLQLFDNGEIDQVPHIGSRVNDSYTDGDINFETGLEGITSNFHDKLEYDLSKDKTESSSDCLKEIADNKHLNSSAKIKNQLSDPELSGSSDRNKDSDVNDTPENHNPIISLSSQCVNPCSFTLEGDCIKDEPSTAGEIKNLTIDLSDQPLRNDSNAWSATKEGTNLIGSGTNDTPDMNGSQDVFMLHIKEETSGGGNPTEFTCAAECEKIQDSSQNAAKSVLVDTKPTDITSELIAKNRERDQPTKPIEGASDEGSIDHYDESACQCGCQGTPLTNLFEGSVCDFSAPEGIQFWLRLFCFNCDTTRLHKKLLKAESNMTADDTVLQEEACKFIVDFSSTLPLLKVSLHHLQKDGNEHSLTNGAVNSENKLIQQGFAEDDEVRSNIRRCHLSLAILYEELDRIMASNLIKIASYYPHAEGYRKKRGGLTIIIDTPIHQSHNTTIEFAQKKDRLGVTVNRLKERAVITSADSASFHGGNTI